MNSYSNIKQLSIKQFESAINKAFEDKSSFSFIRLGDGEGALLDFNEECTIHDTLYLSEHVGKQASLNQLHDLKRNLSNLIDTADIIGVRDDVLGVSFNDALINSSNTELFLDTFKKSFRLRETERNICFADAVRIAKLYKTLKHRTFQTQQFCTQWISFDYFLSGAMTNLLERAGHIGVITARADIPQKLRECLNIKVTEHITPDKSARQVGHFVPHYPEHFERIKSSINVEYNGMPYLVAAGLIGKGYCAEIQQQGGIALDIGALIDCWDGRYSRPKVIESRFTVKKTLLGKKRLPDELKMTKENAARLRQVFNNRHG